MSPHLALSCLVALLAAASPALAEMGGVSEGLQVSLPGEDPATYRSLRGTSPEACASACSEDDWCTGWTLTAPTFRIGPRCELKHVEPTPAAVASTPPPHPSADPVPATAAPDRKAVPEVPPATPAPRPAPRPVPALRGAQERPAPENTPEEADLAPLRYAPAPATGEDKRPALPERHDRQVPAYSVQNMDVLPGDYEATAGYIDGLPDEEETGEDAGN